MTTTANPNAENLYDVLGVTENATPDDVKRAYFALVRKYRPNEHPEAFQKFNDARWMLEDSPRRNKYDQMRRSGRRLKSLLDEAEVAASRDPAAAIPLLRSAVALAPALPLPRALLADIQIQTGEWAAAERQFVWLVKDSDRDETLHFRLALCLFKQDKLADAEARLAAALGINPLYHDALILLAQVYDAMKRISRAIATLERAIENDGVEDHNDLEALLHLLALHILSKNDRGVEKSALRIRTVLIAAGEEELRKGANRLYEVAGEYALQEKRMVAIEMLQQGRRLPFQDELLAQAMDDLRRRTRLTDEANTACADRSLPALLRAYLQVAYLDHTTDPRRPSRIEALRANLHNDRANLGDIPAIVARLQTTFPTIAAEERTFLEDIGAGRIPATRAIPDAQAVSETAAKTSPPAKKSGNASGKGRTEVLPNAKPTGGMKRTAGGLQSPPAAVMPRKGISTTTVMPRGRKGKKAGSWWESLIVWLLKH